MKHINQSTTLRARHRRAAIMRGLYQIFMGATGAAILAAVFFSASVDGPGWALGLTGFSVSAIATAGFYRAAQWAEEGIA